jgi:hypothetical protein
MLYIVKGAARDRIADNLDREFSAEPLHVVFSTKYSCNAATSILRQGLDQSTMLTFENHRSTLYQRDLEPKHQNQFMSHLSIQSPITKIRQ